MADLAHYGIGIDTLRRMYDTWCAGAKKSELERTYLNAPQSHGKLFSSLVREHLGIETERRSAQRERVGELEAEIKRLRVVLLAHGINPGNGSTASPDRDDQNGRKEGNA